MSGRLAHRANNEDGFTLIELLVVILIIGILAAIAIPSFLNQRYKGQDACAKSMVKQMQTAVHTIETDQNNFSGLTLASLTAVEASITGTTAQGSCAPSAVGYSNNSGTGTCNGNSNATTYCVSAVSQSGNTFSLTEGQAGPGLIDRRCSIPSGGNAGGCKGNPGGNGTW